MSNKVLEYFEEISKIPRCSKNEDKIIEYLKSWANDNKFSYKTDSANNLIVYTDSRNNCVALQSHVDMVCEKTLDSKHDFSKDPIKLIYDGDLLTAEDTTLGADNGIGMAMMMALATDKTITDNFQLELLFTVDEETGLNGANGLASNLLNSKYMINLDSEDDNEIIIGCAGGRDILGEKKFNIETATFSNSYKVEVDGLYGGHSGIDIDKNRQNSIKILSELLNKVDGLEIVHFSGGTRHNVIPINSFCIFNTNESFEKIKKISEEFVDKYKNIEKEIKVNVSEIETEGNCLNIENSKNILDILLTLPFGAVDKEKGQVVSSVNLAKVNVENGEVSVLLSIRSSNKSLKEKLAQNLFEIFKKYDFKTYSDNDYPAWQPFYESKILKIAKEIYEEKYSDLQVKVIHAGLECGIIKEKYPDIDVISIGPNINSPHSPNESVSISSISKVYDWCKKIILKLT